jgi:preprotein translocase subunit SecF
MMSALGNIGGRLYRGEVSVEFVSRQRLWYSISGVILAVSVIAVTVLGLNFSVDFRGGAIFEFPAGSVSITQVRQTIQAAGGGSDMIVQRVVPLGREPQWHVQTRKLTPAQNSSVQSAIGSKFHVPQSKISDQFVGPSWGSSISRKATEALIAFLIVIVIYLSIAFEWKMATAALIALAHDIIITIGVYALTGFQVSPASVIGLLTILGYSLYDTVVVFDKVRENTAGLLGSSRSTYSQAANTALNQTLVRSINTSVIALLPVASILFVGAGLLGAGELKDLALVLFVGMLSGTYSSICIATPVLADLKEREPQYKALAKRVALRAAGGRAAKRAAAKASTRGGKGAAGGGEAELAETGGDTEAEMADGVDEGQDGGEEASEKKTRSRPPAETGEPVPAGAAPGAPRRVTPTGPRQQPRRTSAAKRRPGGKKRRR